MRNDCARYRCSPLLKMWRGASRTGLTSLTSLDRLPEAGAVVAALPVKIVSGSGILRTYSPNVCTELQEVIVNAYPVEVQHLHPDLG